MALDAIRDISLSTVKLALSHPLGLIKLPAGETVFTPKERRLLDLHAELLALSRQVVEARELAGLSENRMHIQSHPLNIGRRILGEARISEASLLERIDVANSEYFKAHQDNSNKNLIAERFAFYSQS